MSTLAAPVVPAEPVVTDSAPVDPVVSAPVEPVAAQPVKETGAPEPVATEPVTPVPAGTGQ